MRYFQLSSFKYLFHFESTFVLNWLISAADNWTYYFPSLREVWRIQDKDWVGSAIMKFVCEENLWAAIQTIIFQSSYFLPENKLYRCQLASSVLLYQRFNIFKFLAMAWNLLDKVRWLYKMFSDTLFPCFLTKNVKKCPWNYVNIFFVFQSYCWDS